MMLFMNDKIAGLADNLTGGRYSKYKEKAEYADSLQVQLKAKEDQLKDKDELLKYKDEQLKYKDEQLNSANTELSRSKSVVKMRFANKTAKQIREKLNIRKSEVIRILENFGLYK
ncbi:MAG: hypothetical protein LBQ12_12485 [Deltaproteobacteria bacterium]|jgi:hypothetical protein|nr:hypothetical protein [Deltaproteobacteria bacterium]